MAPTKKITVRISMAHPSGGVQYRPPNSLPGTEMQILEHGKVYEVEETFGRILVKQRRAVLAEDATFLADVPLTSDVLHGEPEPTAAAEPRRRTR